MSGLIMTIVISRGKDQRWFFFPMSGIFTRLGTLLVNHRDIEAGKHLLCVYGDNWIQVCKHSVYLCMYILYLCIFMTLYLFICVFTSVYVYMQDTRFTITALSADRESNALREMEEADERLLALKESRCCYCCYHWYLLVVLLPIHYHSRFFQFHY